MNKKKIVRLIFSDKDPIYIAKKINKWFTENPALFNENLLPNRNIFHFLILNHKTAVIKSLLEYGDFKALACKLDINDQSLIHFLVNKQYFTKDIITLLIEYFPELPNVVDKEGNTPLHLAVKTKNIDAILALISNNNVRRTVKNSAGKTAFDLAEDDQKIKNALLSLDLAHVKPSFWGIKNSPVTSSHAQVYFKFPLLFSSFQSHLPSSIKATQDEDTTFREVSPIFVGSSEASKKKKEVVDFEILFKKLIEAYEPDNTTLSYQQIQKEICFLCDKIEIKNSKYLQDLVLHSRENTAIVYSILVRLSPLVNQRFIEIQENIYGLLKSHIIHILEDSLAFELIKTNCPNFKMLDESREEILRTLWLITSCQDIEESPRQLNLEKMTRRSLGLLSIVTFEELLNDFLKLFPFFDRQQKWMANFIVWQLINYNSIIPFFKYTKELDSELMLFLKCNTDPKIGLSEQGAPLKKLFKSLINFNKNQPLLMNYRLLNTWILQGNMINSPQSFDSLVEQALKGNPSKRKLAIQLIANEIRGLTVSFYQNVSMSEFYHFNWLKENKDLLAPNIVLLTHYFNQLNNYFITKVLEQKPEDVVNALEMLIQLGRQLCFNEKNSYSDINHLMMIASVLNSSVLSRLTEYFELLSYESKKILKEINEISKSTHNYKSIREIYNVQKKSLPCLAILLMDITFAKEGNVTQLGFIDSMGEIFTKIIGVKTSLNFAINPFQTDLPTFLNGYRPSNDDKLYYDSLRFQPRTKDVFDLKFGDPDVVLNQLNELYLDNTIIPNVRLHGKIYSTRVFLKKLLLWFAEHLESTELDVKEKVHRLIPVLLQLQITIEKSIKINNEFYFPKFHPKKINPEYFAAKINELKLHLDELKKLLEENEEKKHLLIKMNSRKINSRFLFFEKTDSSKQTIMTSSSPNVIQIVLPDSESGEEDTCKL
ncbi:TPA: RasGEF domain-containing protein [Legionella pneumophila]|uniref:RasGEF domain-containing protein n=1 Tax=Legionella pneumophila TaxID=446 RepID=UPI0005A62547|nr:RasGEF domain-containing protein [Legionella pneumophila]